MCITVIPSVQISDGPNSAIEDLSPDRGSVTFPVGQAVVQFSVLILDDQVLNMFLSVQFKQSSSHTSVLLWEFSV